ncbi:CND2 protein, partial [Notiomystis cincta]|nr:CND2 protein [Notiomystis cincta]
LGEGDIGTMSLHVSLNPGEYSYFSPRTLSMWAGPEHWRFRPRHHRESVTNPEKDSQKRNPRKVFELDLEEDVDFQPHFCRTKASITLAKSILESNNIRSTTLPADFNYDPQNMVQLFLKPLVKLSRSSEPLEPLDNEAGIEDYDYNNPNDTSNFCPALQVPDSEDDPDPVEFPTQAEAHPEAPEHSRISSGGSATLYGEFDLIAEPHKINKITIQYARTAKRMDMRRLKRNMWELLSEQGAAAEVGPGNPGRRNSRREFRSHSLPSGWRLCQAFPWNAGSAAPALIPILLFHRLPPSMATNLSVPLAFVCLLHLANEKNLKLESTKDLSDILVKQGD